jgi:regulator of PEP synthase PpsR (kinase-PPPase family)
MQQRTVFFVSDSTGITAESLGHLLAHFPDVTFRQFRYPFIDSIQKIEGVVQRIAQAREEDGVRPVIMMTLVDPDYRALVKQADALCLDMFGAIIDPLSAELNMQPSLGVGISHGVLGHSYHERMDAINFSLGHDDGQTNHGLDEAQVILIGVSRCGKTPTSLYLAMQFGIKAANYPLIPEDFERMTLPSILDKYPEKLYGLTIQPERLHSVRSERRPDSFYASLANCKEEVRLAESLMERAHVPWIDSTSRSIEELSTTILQKIKVKQYA